ncbi:MAG TPA: UDP-glucose 4-epimerase GalE [Chromatiaceae bacterium]|jgi:UDP-glucose 4-epimerase|nr:MAG: hypothetical protein N838_05335 [Thiohalocapsa sp. PB-PSB1]QQO55416.1 MAG: UDP-glucose 4-epimerase GalE [Thiohalocapsa sp. PB-PSB1]HBG96522.1 UDP-glucose 4-epimerase GalE [Chromatiaceae bacterium]HCS88748.1 UDP-glucose 4-epimerase GalE [Chromatiaceae bacterium]
MKVLVTGGAGYIGSHTCVELLAAGHEVVVIDNLCNSKEMALQRVRQISGRPLAFVHADLRDAAALAALFREYAFDAVIHFAGLKAVGESVQVPLDYYHNNFIGSLTLCRVMLAAGLRTLVFSSSATVYGDPAALPIREDFPLSATNPYGRTKLFVEEMLRDLQRADDGWNIALLRYFNPAGAHSSGRIGEDPNGVPNNLMPFITQVAIGKQPELLVFGDDYDTPDGTGVRDYIHVVDLAQGHLAALERLMANPGLVTYNLGTGRGYSVLELIHAFERTCERSVPYRVVARRSGDIGLCYADPGLAHAELGWRARFDIEDMVRDSWRWQTCNPDGYT